MPLVRIPTAFDHPDMLWEIKRDGFRAVAIVDDSNCQLMSRNGHTFRRWPDLQGAIARDVQSPHAVLDGEILCVDINGRPNFNALFFGRWAPFFFAVDVLAVDGEELTARPIA